MQAENSEASFDTDSYTHVTLYHPNVDKIMERAEEINLADYEATSANAFQSAVSTLKDLLFDEKATDEQKKTALNTLVRMNLFQQAAQEWFFQQQEKKQK